MHGTQDMMCVCVCVKHSVMDRRAGSAWLRGFVSLVLYMHFASCDRGILCMDPSSI